jgi:hypothetical protein
LKVFLSKIIVALSLVLIPVLCANLLLNATLQRDFSQLQPFWSDEIFYTQQALAFREAQFNAGYFTVSEHAPRLSYSHYYVWSPFVPMLYATLGMSDNISLQLINAVVFSVAIAFSLGVMWRAKWREWAVYTVVLAFFPPLVLLYPFHMQDVLHLAIALVVATGFAHSLISTKHLPRWGWALIAFLAVCVLLRPTWGTLILPALCLVDKRLNIKRFLVWAMLTAVIVLPLAVLFQWSSAPYPHFRSEFFESSRSFGDTLVGWAQYILTSVGLLFSDGNTSAHLQRLQIALFLLWGVGLAVRLKWAHNAGISKNDFFWREWAFHFFNLLAVYGAVLALHEVVDGRDYRVMAPHLLLSLCVAVWRGRWLLVTSLLAIGVLVAPQLLDQYRADMAPLARISDPTYGVETLISYEPHENAWCNTVSLSFYYVIDFTGNADMLLAFDDGLGLSWIKPDDIPTRLQAQYIVLTHDDWQAWGKERNLLKIADVQNGALYQNLDADCTTP